MCRRFRSGLEYLVRGEKLWPYRINAPELSGIERPEGLKFRDFLRNLIGGKKVLIQTVKDRKDKFSRYLADIWLEGDDGEILNVHDKIVAEGFAVYKDYWVREFHETLTFS